MPMEARANSWVVFPRSYSPCFLRQDLLLGPEPTDCAKLTGLWAPVTCPCFCCTNVTSVNPHRCQRPEIRFSCLCCVVVWRGCAPSSQTFEHFVLGWWPCLGAIRKCVLVEGIRYWGQAFRVKIFAYCSFALSPSCLKFKMGALNLLLWAPHLPLAATPDPSHHSVI